MKGYIVIILSQLVTILLWYLAKGSNPAMSFANGATQIVALAGIMSLIWTFILATRARILEKMFGGLDVVYKIHHILGGLALILLINHVLLLIVDSMPANTLSLYLLPGSNLSYLYGMISLYSMLFLVILTLYIKLPYRFWKWSHEWMGIVIIFGGLHSMFVSSDTTSYRPLQYWILVWTILATVSFLYKRFLYYFVGKRIYTIARIGREKELLVISLESENPINFEPGQYGFFALPDKKRDDHAFSILASDQNKLIVGIKVVGNFTEKLATLKSGGKLIVKGPFGTFGQKMKQAEHAVWIAGGIGITPFLSMAKAVRNDQKVEMYFCARVLPPSVITEPFANLSMRNPNFVWLPCETSKGGRLTGQKIYDDTGCDRNAYYMLCGPSVMMEAIASQLAQIGIRRSHIIYEDFAFK